MDAEGLSKYKEKMSKALKFIKESLPKKSPLKEKFDKSIATLEAEEQISDTEKYFTYLKEGISMGGKPLITVLDTICFLFTNNYMNGSIPINQIVPTANSSEPLLSQIILNLIEISNEKDDDVQQWLVKVFLAISTNIRCELHDRNLLEVIRALYKIYITTKNMTNMQLAKATLHCLINIIFQKVHFSQKKLHHETSEYSRLIMNEDDSSECVDAQFNALDEYIYCYTQELIDDVCIYSERCKKIIEANDIPCDETDKDTLIVGINSIGNIPLKSLDIDRCDKALISKIGTLDITNERNSKLGKYGWCFICRSTADLSCKQHRVSVCCDECKKKHQSMLENATSSAKFQKEADTYVSDALMVFNSFANLASKEIKNPPNIMMLKSRTFCLEILMAMVENPIDYIKASPDFHHIIKTTLCDSIMKNSVNTEKTIFSLSLAIFMALILNFRPQLKVEIGVFIEEVFLKILNSGNSSYQHKFLILQVLNKIAINPKIIVELFLNYDCDKDAKSILKSIIDSMAKISQGKFLKSEHTALIQPNEEASLKLISLDTLSIITKGLYEFQEGKQLSESRMSAKNDKSMIDQSQISDDSDTKLEPKGFEKALIEKNQLASAAIKFNIKPKAALAYLTQNGFIAESPIEKRIQDTLIFISKTPELDKGKIGELFGDKDEFNKRLMYAYIDSLNMKGLTLVSSIRLLFSCFRPVGESQIMDRILVKYGEKYTKDNPDKFTNAGIPYEMSYAIMILQTNNHNPQVKKKMTFV